MEINDQYNYELTEEQIAGIEEAVREIEAGKVIPHEAVKAWAESLGTDHELPPPSAGA